MNTKHFEEDNHIKVVENYYSAMLAKDFEQMTSYLHDNVHFIGPLASMQGKSAVVAAAKNLSQLLGDIHIRSKFSRNHQVMFAYDLTFPEPIGVLRAAVLMDISDHLISKIELFYDGRPFIEKRKEIYEDSN